MKQGTRRTIVKQRIYLLLAMSLFLTGVATVPASADGETDNEETSGEADEGDDRRHGEGTTTFTVVPTCTPGVDCEVEDDKLLFTIRNPGSKTGAFKGTQVFDGTLKFNALNPLDPTFTFVGTVEFEGKVKGCGRGTVFLDAEGEGFLNPDGTATFTRNDQVIVSGGTLDIEGGIDEAGTTTPTAPDGSESLDYSAWYSCDDD